MQLKKKGLKFDKQLSRKQKKLLKTLQIKKKAERLGKLGIGDTHETRDCG